MKKSNAGGYRPGAGNKLGSKRVDVRRVQKPLSINPIVFAEFYGLYGRGWSRRIEQLMQQDILGQKEKAGQDYPAAP